MQRHLKTWKFDHNGVTRTLDNPSYPNVGTLVFFLDTRTALDSFVTPERFPNLELVHVDARTDYASLLRLVQEFPLPGLRLSNLGIPDFPGLMAAIRGEAMRKLGLCGVGIHGEKIPGLKELARFTELESLELSTASLGAKGGAILGDLRLPKLRRLTLFHAGLGGPGLRSLARMPGLERLSLGSNRLKSEHLAWLAEGGSSSTLQYLDIGSNRGLDDAALEHLRRLPALTQIQAYGTNITREAAAAYEEASGVTVIGKEELRSGKVVIIGAGKSDTPDDLEDAVDDLQPGAILTMLKAGELAWDGEYDVFSHQDWTRAFHLIAGLGGTKEVTKIVQTHGRSVDERDIQGRTPLFFACIGTDLRPWDGERDRPGADKTLKRLLELGADVHAADNDGRTALHHATHVGAEKCVRRLLRSGAKNIPDKEGDRPSDLARMFERPTLIPLLEKAT